MTQQPTANSMMMAQQQEFEWVPEASMQAPAPAPVPSFPEKYIDGNNTTWVRRPKQVQASASVAAMDAAPQQQFQSFLTPPPAAQANKNSGPLPWPFESMRMQMPPQMTQMMQQLQQLQQQVQQQQQAAAAAPMEQSPPPAEDSRNKAQKRTKADEPAAEPAAKEDAKAAAAAPSEAPAPAENEPPAKKAKTGTTSAPTRNELHAVLDEINKSNMKEHIKARMLDTLAESLEIRDTREKELRGKVSDYMTTIERGMRATGKSDAEITAWKNSCKNVTENPMQHESAISGLAAAASAMSLIAPSSSYSQQQQQPSGGPLGIADQSLTLQRSMDRLNNFINPQVPSIAVQSSAASAPSFPVTGAAQIPMMGPNGEMTVFQPRFANPAALRSDPNAQVKIDPQYGWVVRGQKQDPSRFYNGPIDLPTTG